jgi:hypothetical protein
MKGFDREIEVGASDLGHHDPGIPGPQRGCRDAMGLVVRAVARAKAFRIALVLVTLASSAIVIEAGQRWH